MFAYMKSIFSSLLAISLLAPFATADDKESFQVADLTFEFGEPWIRQQASSSMRAAQLLYDHENEDLEDIEVGVFHMGGTVRANLDRWIGQFEGTPESDEKTEKLGDREVIFFTATGTFLQSTGGPFAGGPKTPLKDHMMLGAIMPAGDRLAFFKLTGPKASVEAMKADFEALVKSAFDE